MFRLSPLAWAVLLLSQSAFAQQDVVTLNTITVVSSREDSPLAKLANNVVVQGEGKLQASQSVNLDDALDRIPGVTFEGSGRFALQDVNIRGIKGSNRVKLMSDGLELGDAVGFGPFHSSGRQYTDLNNVKQVEVIKGPASSLHGSDAIGGVVSLVSKSADDYLTEGKTTAGNVFAQYSGKNDGVTTGFNVAHAFTPNSKALFSYSYQDNDEVRNKGTVGGLGAKRTLPNPHHQQSHSLGMQLSHQFSEGNALTLAVNHYQLNADSNVLSSVVERGATPPAAARPSTGATASTGGRPPAMAGNPSAGATASTGGRPPAMAGNPSAGATASTGGRPPMGGAPSAGSSSSNNVSGHVTAPTTRDYQYLSDDQQKRFAISLRHDLTLNNAFADTAYWRAYAQQHKSVQRTDILREGRGGLSKVYRDNLFKSHDVGFSAQLDKHIDGALSHDIVYGVDVKTSRYEIKHDGYNRVLSTGQTTPQRARNAPISDITHIGLFAQDRIGFGNSGFALIPGVRYDHYRLKAKPDELFYLSNGGSRNFQFLNYNKGKLSLRLGALYDVNESNTLYFNYAQGFRMPSFMESNVAFTSYQRGYGYLPNPNLRSESSHGFDWGWRMDNGVLNSDLSFYYTRYKDFIRNQVVVGKDAEGIMRFKTGNLPSAEIYGVEWSAGVNAGALSESLNGLRADVTLAYGKGKNRQTGTPINSVEPFNGVLGVHYEQDRWGASANWNFAAGKKAGDIEGDTAPTAGYGTLDLSAYYKPMNGLTVRAGVYNVFDKKYISWNDASGVNEAERDRYTAPGRWVGVSLKYDF